MTVFIHFGSTCFSGQFSTLKIWKKYDTMDYFAAILKKQQFLRFLLYINSFN